MSSAAPPVGKTVAPTAGAPSAQVVTVSIGVTRNRTIFFQQCRSSYRTKGSPPLRSTVALAHRVDEKAGLIANDVAGKDFSLEMTTLPPRWVDLVDEITEDMKKMSKQMQDLEALHTKQLRPSFSETEHRRNEQAIEHVTNQITTAFYTCQDRIKRIAVDDDSSNGEAKLGQNVQKALATKLQDQSSQFRKLQSDYIARIRGRIERNSDKSAFEELPSGANPAFDIGYTDQQLATMVNNDREISQREAEINEIAKSIFQLSDLFKELQNMVVEQGTMLDRIDYNIDQTVVHVKQGHKELVQGEEYQKSARAKYCILFLGSLVCILILGLIAKGQGSSS